MRWVDGTVQLEWFAGERSMVLLDPRKLVNHIRRVQVATYTCMSAFVHMRS